jgi:hypothetical protein
MASISKSYGYDVGKGGDPTKPRRATYKGEKRNEKVPRGHAERFVDLQGTVVVCQLVSPGVPATQEAVQRARTQLHAAKNNDGTVQGFVEHGKCPLRHGVRHRNEIIEAEFAALPEDLQRPCATDPAGSTRERAAGGGIIVNHGDGCPHVEWLIVARREKESERTASRRARGDGVIEIERKKLALMEKQAAEAQKTNERLVEALASRQPRKGSE